METNGHSPLPG